MNTQTISANAAEHGEQAVCLAALPPGQLLLVETRNSQYRIVLTDPRSSRARITGGRAFSEPTEIRVVGARSGAGFRKPGWISAGLGMEIAVGDQHIATSTVHGIHVVPDETQLDRSPR